MNMGEKINYLRNKHNMTLEELGNKVGVGKSTVRKWENGMIANMRRDKIAKLAQALNVSPAYLMGWEDEPGFPALPQYNNIYPIKKKSFPLLGEIACGVPIFANEDRESYVEASTDIHADFCLKAKGDSMINARINDGDIVFIRKQSAVNNGEIAAVIIDDTATLKRVFFYPQQGQLILQAENPAFPPLVYTGEDINSVHILGKAIAFQSDVK